MFHGIVQRAIIFMTLYMARSVDNSMSSTNDIEPSSCEDSGILLQQTKTQKIELPSMTSQDFIKLTQLPNRDLGSRTRRAGIYLASTKKE